MKEDNQNINTNNLQALQDEASNYLTDSDIDDPKYTPISTKYNYVHTFNTQDDFNTPLQKHIRSLNKDTENKLQSVREVDKENNLLKTELFKLQEALQAKDIVIQEFEHLSVLSRSRFKEFEEVNEMLVKENEQLRLQLNDNERQLKTYHTQLQFNESNVKNIKLYEEHINELQNGFNEKEAKIKKRYQEKEEGIKREYLSQIQRLTKELDNVKIENEQLKYELSANKMRLEQYASEAEEKEYEYSVEMAKKSREYQKMTEQVKEITERFAQFEMSSQKKLSSTENALYSVKDNENNMLLEANNKDEQIQALENDLSKASHQIEMMNNDYKELLSKCDNKDAIIEQLKNQNSELYRELESREGEMVEYDQLKVKEFEDNKEQLTAVIREKNSLEEQNIELIENLHQANEQLRKLNDLITDKYASIEMSLYKQTSRNENMEKKYNTLIKEMKAREKALNSEVKNLRDILHDQGDKNEKPHNESRNSSLYNTNFGMNSTFSPMVNHSMSIPNNNYNTYDSNNGFEDHTEEGQKKTLEEFRRLLTRIDEKLDLPLKN